MQPLAETHNMTAKPTSAWAGWIRLTRPWNVLAMGVMVVVIQRWLGISLSAMWKLEHVGWVVIPMLVGAAGNLINDYFDVREDRINKPERALVGRVVKRRVVLVSHWGLTAVSLLWSALLSTHLHSYWPLGWWLLFQSFWPSTPLFSKDVEDGGILPSHSVLEALSHGAPFLSLHQEQQHRFRPFNGSSLVSCLLE